MKLKACVFIFHPVSGHLLLKRLTARGGDYQPVTGGVEPNEPVLLGAQREVFEETGFRAEDGSWEQLEAINDFESPWGPAREYNFLFSLKNTASCEVKLDSSEHMDFLWTRDAALVNRELIHPPQRKAFAEALVRMKKKFIS